MIKSPHERFLGYIYTKARTYPINGLSGFPQRASKLGDGSVNYSCHADCSFAPGSNECVYVFSNKETRPVRSQHSKPAGSQRTDQLLQQTCREKRRNAGLLFCSVLFWLFCKGFRSCQHCQRRAQQQPIDALTKHREYTSIIYINELG